MFMEIFVTAMIVMAMVCAVVHLWRKNVGSGKRADERVICVSWVLLVTCVVTLLDLASGDCGFCRLAFDLSLPLLCLYLMSLSLLDYKNVSWTVRGLMALELLPAIYYLLCICGLSLRILQGVFMLAASVVALAFPVAFLFGFIGKLKSVKEVMKSGNVWGFVCLGVDAVYAFMSMFFVISLVLAELSGWDCRAWLAVFPLLGLCGTTVALALRICDDSLFLIWTGQERRIVESMKVASVASSPDKSHIEEVYKDIYERIVTYFDKEKPYLNSELAIADLVKVLYSNKLYISRSISQFTGRNFRQFVNYHRVKYSMECFRENPDLKVHEMGAMSGFNSVVSYNMAFRLFMGENPSDWCRKEKGRMVKGKK